MPVFAHRASQLVGKTVDNYEILEILGRGGMGVVYKAIDVSLGKIVALKMLNPSYLEDDPFLRRFQSEAKALGRLQHPYIVNVFAFRHAEPYLFLVMEYVDGGTLTDLIQDQGAIPWKDAMPIMRQALSAVGYAHQHKVIHRDVKPRNILLTQQKTVKMTDFGLAKIQESSSDSFGATRTGFTGGTLYYMPPEQLEGLKHVDHRGDIYSLGMTFYEALAGKIPFDRSSSEFQVLKAIEAHDFSPLDYTKKDIPHELARIIMKAVEKAPGDRYQSAESMLVDLVRFEREGPWDVAGHDDDDDADPSSRASEPSHETGSDDAESRDFAGRNSDGASERTHGDVSSDSSNRRQPADHDFAETVFMSGPPIQEESIDRKYDAPDDIAASPPSSTEDPPKRHGPSRGRSGRSSAKPEQTPVAPRVDRPKRGTSSSSSPLRSEEERESPRVDKPTKRKAARTTSPAPARDPQPSKSDNPSVRYLVFGGIALAALLVVGFLLYRPIERMMDAGVDRGAATVATFGTDEETRSSEQEEDSPSDEETVATEDGESGEDKVVAPPTTAELVLYSEPPGAQVWIDGVRMAGVTQMAVPEQAPGRHRVVIRKEGFQDYDRRVTLTAGETARIVAALVPLSNTPDPPAPEPDDVAANLKAEVEIVAQPYGTIRIDGKLAVEAKIGPYAASLSPGEHVIQVTHDVYGTWEKSVRLTAGSNPRIVCNFMERVALTVTAPGAPYASIIIDGEDTKRFTPAVLEVTRGLHTIEVRQDGYRMTERPRRVMIDGPTTVSLNLEAVN